MRYDIVGGNTFPMLRVYLDQGESLRAESGAMVSMTRDLRLTGKMDGGFLKSLGRLFTGESFFLQKLAAEEGPGWALLAPAAPGEIIALDIDPKRPMTLQKSSFLAGTEKIDISTEMQSVAKGLFSGEGFFVIGIAGSGTVFLSTYGSVYTVDIPKGESLLIDNGHLVAWETEMDYEIAKGASSWVSSVTSGEGLACRFTGPGKVLIQTRNPAQLGRWIFPFIPFPQPVQK
jgi:uncharacterized protein (TIGR00266 family)